MEKTPFLPRSSRILSLDALRGFAVLGLVSWSVYGFSMLSAASINPMAYGNFEGVNKAIWMVSHVALDQKSILVLAMVFGAGILLFVENVKEKGFAPAGFFYRRMLWWLVFGVVHAYVFWHGDYLVSLAICGALAFLFRGLSPWTLLALSAMIYMVPSFNYWLFGKSMEFWPPEAIQQLNKIWHPDQAAVNGELNALRGGILDQLAWRIPEAFKVQTYMFIVINGWRILAMMMIGMGLYKTGIWDGEWRTQTCLLLAVAAIFTGWWLSIAGVQKNFAASWVVSYSMFFGWQWNHIGSLFTAVGYVALMMLLSTRMRLRLLANIGRLACTNMLITTLICSFLFYGHGLGLLGKVERTGQTFIILGLLTILLLFSHYWLRRFYFGPVEWLLRLLTYGNAPQFKK